MTRMLHRVFLKAMDVHYLTFVYWVVRRADGEVRLESERIFIG